MLSKRIQLKGITFLLAAFFVSAWPLLAMAQDPGGGPDVPIDGGLSILLTAGVAYGVKRYREGKRDKKNQEDEGTQLK